MSRHLVALVLVGSLAVAGCSGDDDEGSGASNPPQGVEDPTELAAFSPLTGVPLVGDIPAHPVVAVKIDNSSSSAPQLGLGEADLVTEELVEGGITRLAVFFYEAIPEVTGPVRSMRATDIGIVQPADAVLVASGGAAPTVQRMRKAGVTFYTEGAPGFFRDSGRSAPYNLMMRLPELVETLEEGDPPPPYLPFGDAEDFPGGRPAKGLTASFSDSSDTTFEYRRGAYTNTDTYAEEPFRPATVLVLRVRVGDAGYLDPAGNPVPETVLTGTGAAMVFHGGRVVRGTWSKDGLDAPITLSTAAGALSIPPGKVWIELVPADGGDVTIRPR